MQVLSKKDFTPFYKTWTAKKHSNQSNQSNQEDNEEEQKPYELGNVYNQPAERVLLKHSFSNIIEKGDKVDQDLIRSKYSVLHTPDNVHVLKNLLVRPHPVVACYCTAYSEHYPLIVSPDHIWMLITQGLVKHLAVRPELIGNNGDQQKMDIVVAMPQYIDPVNGDINWEGVVNEIHHTIVNDVSNKGDEKKIKLMDFLDHNFSTSSQVEKVASKMLMMEAFKDFYSYKNDFLCGLPSVTILGKMDDWLQMKEKLLVLDDYDMKWWRKVLTLILDKIIKTAQEETVTEELKTFWNAIALFDSSSGFDYISGWINYFFPYDKENNISYHLQEFIDMDGKFDENEPYVDNFEQVHFEERFHGDSECENEFKKLAKTFSWRQAIEMGSFPNPITSTSVEVLNHPMWKEFYYISGFMGVDFNPELEGILPVISWAVATERDQAIRDNIISRCKFDHAPWSIDCGSQQWKASISISNSVGVTTMVIPTNDDNIYSNSERMKEMFMEFKEHMEKKYTSDKINLDEGVKFFSSKVVHVQVPEKDKKEMILSSAKEAGLLVLQYGDYEGELLIPYAFIEKFKNSDCLVVNWSSRKPSVTTNEVSAYYYSHTQFEKFLDCCSGRDFSSILSKYLEETHNTSLDYKQCEKAIISLSTNDSTIIELTNNTHVTITREEFYDQCEKEFTSFENSLREAIKESMVPPQYGKAPNIKHVIVSGGTFNMPKLKEIVQQVISELLPGASLFSTSIDPAHIQSVAGAHYFRFREYESLQYMHMFGGNKIFY